MMNYNGSAMFWLQYVEARINEMGWEELAVVIALEEVNMARGLGNYFICINLDRLWNISSSLIH